MRGEYTHGHVARIHRWLAGSDGPGVRALPAGEFLHPAPLVALVLLGLNDHWLKGADLLPGLVTGKLSDFAGLLFFPLLVTTTGNLCLLLLARVGGLAVDFSLSRGKLALGCGATAALFASIKLSPAAAEWAAACFSQLGFHAQIVADPTDLVALPSLLAAYLLGTREIARVPLGRLEVLERAYRRGRREISPHLADVVACGGDSAATAKLATGLAGVFSGDDDAQVAGHMARDALTTLRS